MIMQIPTHICSSNLDSTIDFTNHTNFKTFVSNSKATHSDQWSNIDVCLWNARSLVNKLQNFLALYIH